MEPLEHRAMLSYLPMAVVPIGNTPSPPPSVSALVFARQAINHPSQPVPSESVNDVDTPPIISNFRASQPIGPFWIFSGKVTAGDNPVAGRIVTFGGVLAKYHITATVKANGTFSVTEYLPGLQCGTATAQTHDVRGVASNLAMCGIINPRLAR
jgi:hypothetical protein